MFNGRLTARKPGGGPTRLWRGCVCAFLLGVTAGCYVYPPANPSPGAGTRLLLKLNDKGRVAMEKSIGPSGRFIEGVLLSNSDSAFALRVVRVEYLSGQSNKWSGEPLMVSRDFVSETKERKLSQGRTWLTVAGVAGAMVAFIASRGLLGGGSGDPNERPPENPPVN